MNRDQSSNSQFLIYQPESGQTKIDIRFQEETWWLTQALIAELFQTTSQNITPHRANCKDFFQVRLEGGRRVKRASKHYNLDMIISADICV